MSEKENVQRGLAPSGGLACDGSCAKTGHCKGTVQKVEVLDITGRTWGQYNYCATARATDRANGYTVTLAG